MNKYIDAEKLEDKLIEIEKRHPAFGERLYDNAYSNCLSEVRLIISSLLKEQEQPDYKEVVQLVFEEELTPFKDGNQWCFLLGRNLQDGICGFGDTILDAAVDFYKDYMNTKIHIGELKISMAQQEQPEVDLEKLGGIARHLIAVKDHEEDMRLDESEWLLLERIGYPERFNARKK